MAPRISAIICTYRRPEYLSLAIRSLCAQSLPHDQYEIIVIDNNSGDATPDVVKSFSACGSDHITHCLEEKQGLSHAKNAGVDLAKGEIVAFLDDDAEADSQWLEELLHVYDEHPDAWCVGGRIVPVWDAKRPEWLDDSLLGCLSILNWGESCRALVWPERNIGVNSSLRKEAFMQVGMFRADLGRRGASLIGAEDTELQQRIHEIGKKVYYNPRAIVRHHVVPERLEKKFFYRRCYDGGRTHARLVLNSEGHLRLLWQMLKQFPVAAKRCASYILKMTLGLLGEEEAFGRERELMTMFGFSTQALLLLVVMAPREDG